jgi:hypothetical protein
MIKPARAFVGVSAFGIAAAFGFNLVGIDRAAAESNTPIGSAEKAEIRAAASAATSTTFAAMPTAIGRREARWHGATVANAAAPSATMAGLQTGQHGATIANANAFFGAVAAIEARRHGLTVANAVAPSTALAKAHDAGPQIAATAREASLNPGTVISSAMNHTRRIAPPAFAGSPARRVVAISSGSAEAFSGPHALRRGAATQFAALSSNAEPRPTGAGVMKASASRTEVHQSSVSAARPSNRITMLTPHAASSAALAAETKRLLPKTRQVGASSKMRHTAARTRRHNH